MKYLLKITFYLLLVITAISCNKKPEIIYRLIELEDEPATVQKVDGEFYFELKNKHPELSYTSLMILGALEGFGYMDGLPAQYCNEGLTVIISGSVTICKDQKNNSCLEPQNAHFFYICSIEADE